MVTTNERAPLPSAASNMNVNMNMNVNVPQLLLRPPCSPHAVYENNLLFIELRFKEIRLGLNFIDPCGMTPPGKFNLMTIQRDYLKLNRFRGRRFKLLDDISDEHYLMYLKHTEEPSCD